MIYTNMDELGNSMYPCQAHVSNVALREMQVVLFKNIVSRTLIMGMLTKKFGLKL